MESRLKKRNIGRNKRKMRTRRRIRTIGRPRLSVFRSSRNMYAQIIDDLNSKTLAATSTLDPVARKELPSGGTKLAAKWVGARIAELAAQNGVTEVVFDRSCYRYHGRVKELADAAREGGLKF